MNFGAVLAFMIGAIVVLLIAKIFSKSSMVVLKLLINSIIGGVALWLFNLIFDPLFGFSIGVNYVTAAVVGLLGVPGFILLIILKFIFNS